MSSSSSTTKSSEDTKKLRGQYYKAILKLLSVGSDTHAKKLCFAMAACAGVFAFVDTKKARVGGDLFTAIFRNNKSDFKRLLLQNLGLCIVLAVFNKMLANLISSLGRHWHKRLVDAIHKMYFKGNMSYYKIQHMVELPHERIATDVPQLTRDLALVSSDFIVAAVNFGVLATSAFRFGREIANGRFKNGFRFVSYPVLYVALATLILAKVTPNLGKIKSTQRTLESQYHHSQSRLRTNAEAIALYRGEAYERDVSMSRFASIMTHLQKVRWSTFPYEMIKEYLTRYCVYTVMLGVIMKPFMDPNDPSKGGSIEVGMSRMRVLVELVTMELVALSQFGRLYATLQHVNGLVDRVGKLVSALNEINDPTSSGTGTGTGSGVGSSGSSSAAGSSTMVRRPSSLGLSESGAIEFKGVTVKTPDGHVLVRDLTVTVVPGESLLICGPNGSGKSSIFRCLGGLWKADQGTILRPATVSHVQATKGQSDATKGQKGVGSDSSGSSEAASSGLHEKVFYLPQKPYTVIGTLAQNISYPDLDWQIEEKQLVSLLRLVELEHLYVRTKQAGELNSTLDWSSRLSLGEQQRLAIARLFGHRPTFAILDECTSAVSLKMERRLFKVCRLLGISLITISHRPALQELHDRMLALDGSGGYKIINLKEKRAQEEKAAGGSAAEASSGSATGSGKQGKTPSFANRNVSYDHGLSELAASIGVSGLSAGGLSGASSSLGSNALSGGLPFDQIVNKLEKTGSLAKFDIVSDDKSSGDEDSSDPGRSAGGTFSAGGKLVNGTSKSGALGSKSGRVKSKDKKLSLEELQRLARRGKFGPMTDQSVKGLSMVIGTSNVARAAAAYHLITSCWSRRDVLRVGGVVGIVGVRTFITNKLARLTALSFELLAKGDVAGFRRLIAMAFFLGFVQAVCIPTLSMLEGYIADSWRIKVTKLVMGEYLANRAYYKVGVSKEDAEAHLFAEADNIIVEDIEKLTNSCANLWSEFAKPAVDFAVFGVATVQLLGWKGIGYSLAYMTAGSAVLQVVRPDLAGLQAKKQQLDAEFLSLHERVSAHAESIAFLAGGSAELAVIQKALDAKVDHQLVHKRYEHAYGVADQFVSVFLPLNAAWVLSMMFRQIASNEKDEKSKSSGGVADSSNSTLATAGSSSSSNSTSASDSSSAVRDVQLGEFAQKLRYLAAVVTHSFSALGLLVELGTKFESMKGYFDRVAGLLSKLEDLGMTATPDGSLPPRVHPSMSRSRDRSKQNMAPIMTLAERSGILSMDSCDIGAPGSSKVLLKELTFRVNAGKAEPDPSKRDSGLLVTGPNGCGKSGILRCFAGLATPLSGSLESLPESVLYCPTKPYLCYGNLADQVTYPERANEQSDGSIILQLMETLKLGYLAQREKLFGGLLDTWDIRLSLGEQQRICVARLLYAHWIMTQSSGSAAGAGSPGGSASGSGLGSKAGRSASAGPFADGKESTPASSKDVMSVARRIKRMDTSYSLAKLRDSDKDSKTENPLLAERTDSSSIVFWAFLDECTSAIALDGEEDIYREIAKRGMAILSSSQKPWLLQYHSKILALGDTPSSWEFNSVTPQMIAANMYGVVSRLTDAAYVDKRQAAERGRGEDQADKSSETPKDTTDSTSPPLVFHSPLAVKTDRSESGSASLSAVHASDSDADPRASPQYIGPEPIREESTPAAEQSIPRTSSKNKSKNR